DSRSRCARLSESWVPGSRFQVPGSGSGFTEPSSTRTENRNPEPSYSSVLAEEREMKKRYAALLSLLMFGAGWSLAAAQKPAPGGYVLERDGDIAVTEPGTHN